ncbi:MAG: hypothetical protein H0U02_03705 [Rubrobacter sp.]|jgi:type II secretory pathway pseudopilin PulG|nr:hypothetical protein [Rubrobacter sp.]
MSYRRFIRDETGMTMGLTVIMIVLIGVMGAGLLTFVSTDLNAVIEVNRGQRAMELADAGIDAAKRQLNVDAKVINYNDDPTDGGDSEWADDGTPKELDFDGDGATDIEVWIQYLRPSRNDAEASLPDHAPEVLPSYGADACNDTNGDGVDDDLDLDPAVNDLDACQYPNNRNYFRVTAQGMAGNAVRKVQAIYRSQNYQFPVAYYATRDINIGGSAATVTDVSLFANRYISGLRPPVGTAPTKLGTLRGVDKAYGDWAVYPTGTLAGQPNPHNNVARTTNAAGAAALGNDAVPTGCTLTGNPRITNEGSGITYDSTSENKTQKNRDAETFQVYGNRDYDRDSEYKCDNASNLISSGRPDFEKNTWTAAGQPQPADTITFPFEVNDTGTDDDILEALKQKAQAQGLYVFAPNGAEIEIDDSTGPKTPDGAIYPADSDGETVMYIEFADGAPESPIYGDDGGVLFKANGTSNPDGYAAGTIVVVNGDFDTNASANDFRGIIALRDADDLDDPSDVHNLIQYDSDGNFDVDGYVNVEGDITIRGSVEGLLPGELVNGIPGIYSLRQWSWRECYTTSCN